MKLDERENISRSSQDLNPRPSDLNCVHSVVVVYGSYKYNIVASNCGHCPDTTTSTRIKSPHAPVLESMYITPTQPPMLICCADLTVVCDDIIGNF